MYKFKKPTKTSLLVNKSYIGETIEAKVRRIVNNKEPIKDGAPLIYTERGEGVRPDYNPRTDRWEHAIDAMDKVTQARIAKREERAKGKVVEMKKDSGSDPKPIEGTDKV